MINQLKKKVTIIKNARKKTGITGSVLSTNLTKSQIHLTSTINSSKTI